MGIDISTEALKKKLNADGNLELTELVEVSILSMYFIQRLGKATTGEVQEKMKAQHAIVDVHLLQQGIEALQARGLVSHASGRQGKIGERVVMWKAKNTIWAAPPEVAHIVDLLPNLVSTEEAQALIAQLNGQEEEGDGESKSTRKLGYDEYIDCRAEFITIDEFLGSQPSSPHLDALCKNSKYNGVTATLRFWRDPRDGALVLPSDCVRGWLRTGLRTEGFGDAAASYLGVSEVKIYPKKPLSQVALPVIDPRTGAGKGLTTYEVLQPGERFFAQFRIPTRGFMDAATFEMWLAGYGPAPVRGLSPARGGRFGKVALLSFEELGSCSDASVLLSSVSSGVPDEAKAYYAKLQERAKGVNLRKGHTAAKF